MKNLLSIVVIAMLGISGVAEAHYINLTGGTLAGRPLSSSEWVIDIAPGQAITGNILCTAYGARSSAGVVIPFGYTWTWGLRSSAIVALSGNLPQSASNWDVSINLTAPAEPGVYHIIFGLRGEFNMSSVFSSTNWTAGAAVWNDGNDFHDMDESVLEGAHETGDVHGWPLLRSGGTYSGTNYGVMPIKVIVYDPVPAERSSWSQIKALFR